jgi:hypothetical protein
MARGVLPTIAVPDLVKLTVAVENIPKPTATQRPADEQDTAPRPVAAKSSPSAAGLRRWLDRR